MAPPLTRIRPAASRLTVREWLPLSSSTDRSPEPGEKVALVAMGSGPHGVWGRRAGGRVGGGARERVPGRSRGPDHRLEGRLAAALRISGDVLDFYLERYFATESQGGRQKSGSGYRL